MSSASLSDGGVCRFSWSLLTSVVCIPALPSWEGLFWSLLSHSRPNSSRRTRTCFSCAMSPTTWSDNITLHSQVSVKWDRAIGNAQRTDGCQLIWDTFISRGLDFPPALLQRPESRGLGVSPGPSAAPGLEPPLLWLPPASFQGCVAYPPSQSWGALRGVWPIGWGRFSFPSALP